MITQDGVSVIDLAYATEHEPSIVPPIPVADPSAPPEDVEVDIVATGEYAAVRQANVAALRIVNVGAKYLNGYREFAGKKVAPGWTNWFTVLSHTQYYNFLASEDGRFMTGQALNIDGGITI